MKILTTVIKQYSKNELKLLNYTRIYVLWLYSFIILGAILLIKTILFQTVNDFERKGYVSAPGLNYNLLLGINISYFNDLLYIIYLIESLFLFFTLFLVLLTFINKEITENKSVLSLNSKDYINIIIIAIIWNLLTFFSSHQASVINSMEINFKIMLGLVISVRLLKNIEIPLSNEFKALKNYGLLIGTITLLLLIMLLFGLNYFKISDYNNFYDTYLYLFDVFVGILYIGAGIFFIWKLKKKDSLMV